MQVDDFSQVNAQGSADFTGAMKYEQVDEAKKNSLGVPTAVSGGKNPQSQGLVHRENVRSHST